MSDPVFVNPDWSKATPLTAMEDVTDALHFPVLPGRPGGPRCMCMACPHNVKTRVMFNGKQIGCVIFVVEGEEGLIVQRMAKMPDGSTGLNWRVLTGKVELLAPMEPTLP